MWRLNMNVIPLLSSPTRENIIVCSDRPTRSTCASYTLHFTGSRHEICSGIKRSYCLPLMSFRSRGEIWRVKRNESHMSMKKMKKNWTNLKTAICQPWSLLHKSNFYVYEMMKFFFELILNKCDFGPKCPTVLLYRGVKSSALLFFEQVVQR